MSTPAISVLMTVFNAGAYLDSTIQSILDQSFRDFEFLIVDDASTDHSVKISEGWAKRDSRIRLVANAVNKGQTACLNQGLRLARGGWIARQDADDLSRSDRLRKQWKAIVADPSVIIVGVNGRIIDEMGETTGMIHAPLRDQGIRWSLPFRNPFIHTGVVFRRELPDGTPALYDEQYRICQDWDLWDRLLLHGRGANLPERLVHYRYHGDSLSHRFSERTNEETGRIVRAIWRGIFPACPSARRKTSFCRIS